MLVRTKHFGEIDLAEDKILTFDQGLMGFEYCTKFTILFDSEAKERPAISWLQSCDEPGLALPVISPLLVKPDYNPVVEDEFLQPLGDLNDENLVILLTLTVPADIKLISTNLKAPIVINSDTRKGCQVIAENQDYCIKYRIYDILSKAKEGKGE